MKKFILLNLVIFIFSSITYSQMQKGDKSIGFDFFLRSSEGSTMGNFNLNYGYNVSDHIKLSAGSGFVISSSPSTGTFNYTTFEFTPGENEITTLASFSFDALYYFSNKAKFSPYVGLGLFGTKGFSMFDLPIGVNYFFTKQLSWNTALKLGVGNSSVDDINGKSQSSSSFSVVITSGLQLNF